VGCGHHNDDFTTPHMNEAVENLPHEA